jgi:hypothetical protein
MTTGLSDMQIHAVELLALGKPVTEAAKRCGVDRSTLHRWMNELPDFVAELATRRDEIWQNSGDIVRNLLQQALGVLRKLLDSPEPAIQLKAIAQAMRLASNKLAQPKGLTDPQDILDEQIRQQKRREGVKDWRCRPTDEERAARLNYLQGRRTAGELASAEKSPAPAPADAPARATPAKSATTVPAKTYTPPPPADAARRSALHRAVAAVPLPLDSLLRAVG